MASFESVNYTLRLNKNVERKLMFEALQCIGHKISLIDYQYIGMGSMWFVDLIMAHRLLHIQDLISLEHSDYADRAIFNKPYDCVQVVPGDTSTLLPTLNWGKKTIIWLDYDTGVSGPLFDDLTIVGEKINAGSIIMITAKAHIGDLPNKKEDGSEFTRREAMEYTLGQYIPQDMQPVKASQYPEILGRSIFVALRSHLRVRSAGLSLLPIFHFYYKDGAPMVTVGAIVVDETQGYRELVESSGVFSRFPYFTGETQYTIKVPPLTQKEKMALDNMMPSISAPKELLVRAKYGFSIDQELLDNFFQLYRAYPTFSELAI
ncbi:O-methyltransferase [Burkholderia sp. BCC1644]|uniref:O-methyltransferase n=1 Tax=Burkholderia sp. BCC1644 TaxID=2676293 RepID=UPI0015916484|nr:O-methyltransferase [Burkholderia sp. BCC1644]